MQWTRISLKTDAEHEGLVADMLLEKGFEGVEIIDNKQISDADKKKMFIDILPELDETDETATVNCYFDVAENVNEKLELVKEGLSELSFFMNTDDIEITVSNTEDKDWVNNWKEFFKPFTVGDEVLIRPTWIEKTPEEIVSEMGLSSVPEIVMSIDPGTAFGTGAHETTKLCILALRKYLKPGMKVLDAGCGSGILSIAARLFGASETLGLDIDENAVKISRENAEINNIDGNSVFEYANVLADEGLRNSIGRVNDIVVANILADVIMPLSGVVRSVMKDDGIFISSGIINTREKEVESRLKAEGFEILEVFRMGDWVAFVAK